MSDAETRLGRDRRKDRVIQVCRECVQIEVVPSKQYTIFSDFFTETTSRKPLREEKIRKSRRSAACFCVLPFIRRILSGFALASYAEMTIYLARRLLGGSSGGAPGLTEP